MDDQTRMAQYRAQMAFDARLQPDDIVQVRWTNSGLMLRTSAQVVKVNKNSIRVKLLEATQVAELHWPAGQEFPAPRINTQGWSWNNGLFPL